MNEQIIMVIFGLLISVIGFFLKALYTDFKRLDQEHNKLNTKVEVIDTNNKNLTDRFDELYSAVKELTNEIKHLSLNLERNKKNEK